MIMLRLSSSPSVFFKKRDAAGDCLDDVAKSKQNYLFGRGCASTEHRDYCLGVHLVAQNKMHCRPTDLHSYSKSSCGLGAFGLQSHVVNILCRHPFRTHVFISLAQYPPTAPETR